MKNTTGIDLGNKLISPFVAIKFFRRDCCLFSSLFIISLDITLVGWLKKYKNVGLKVDGLYFAENQIVLAEDEDFAYMARKQKEVDEMARFTLNMLKCEYIIVGYEDVKALT